MDTSKILCLVLLTCTTVCRAQRAILFDDINYGGASKQVSISQSCIDIRDFNDRVSSVKTEACISLWADAFCTGQRLDIAAPGNENLVRLDFNDKATSASPCGWGKQNPDKMRFNIDTSQAPHLRDFGDRVKTILEAWFPYLQNLMVTPAYTPWPEINVIFDQSYDGVAYASENNIVANPRAFEEHQNDYGAFIHELTHNLQKADHAMSRGCPGWLVEGYAEWTRRWHYEPWTARDKPGQDGSYKNGYSDAAWLLVYVNSAITQTPVLYHVNKACQEGTYNDQIWRDLTGKSVDELWNDMMKDNGYPCRK